MSDTNIGELLDEVESDGRTYYGRESDSRSRGSDLVLSDPVPVVQHFSEQDSS